MRRKVRILFVFSAIMSVIVFITINILWKQMAIKTVDKDIIIPHLIGCTFVSDENPEDCVIVTEDNIKKFDSTVEWDSSFGDKKCLVKFDMVLDKNQIEYEITGSLYLYYDKDDCMSWHSSRFNVSGYDIDHVTWVKLGSPY